MAGGKETPRQKMIGLMYLVLLAMLALQVSSVIIEKFQQLNDSLERSNNASSKRNETILAQIKQAVEKGKFAKQDVEVLNAANATRKETEELLAYLDSLKLTLVNNTGGKDELGNYNGAKEEEPISNFMLGSGDSKSGKAYELKRKLDAYTAQLISIAKKHEIQLAIEGLALDGKENPMFKNNPEQKRKDFAHLNFEGTPLVAALAVMSERGNKVMSIEAELLSELASKVGAINIPIDKVRPVVKATSNMVVAGTSYNAEFFMAAYSSSFKPEMTYNSTALVVDGEGVGKVSFKASGGNYTKEGLLKKTWTGTIKYPKSGGGDTIYTVTQDYFVVKPYVDITTAIPPSLYKDCGNKLSVQVPALGVDYNPIITAEGAEVRRTSVKGEVIIIPHAPKMKLRVKSNDVFIDEKEFSVHLIPKPEIVVKCGGRLVDQITGTSVTSLRDVEVEPIPDREFKKTNPQEAQYKTVYWKASLVRNGRIKGQPIMVSGQTGSLRNLQAESGDRIIIEEVKVKRKNFEGRILDEEIGDKVFVIPVQ